MNNTINSISYRLLRNNEFFGLHSQGVTFARELAEKDLQATIAAYESSVKELGEFLEASFTESSETQAKLMDKDRNAVYVSCKRVAQGSLDFPDAAIANVWAQVWRVLSESQNPLNLNQVQSTGVYLNLVSALRKIGDEALDSIGFKVRLDQLEQANLRYMEADNARLTDRGKRELEVAKKLRDACLAAYGKLVLAVNYKASIGNEPCLAFVHKMNEAIDGKKAQVKARTTRSKKKTEASAQGAAPAQEVAPAQHSETAPAQDAAPAKETAPVTASDSAAAVNKAA